MLRCYERELLDLYQQGKLTIDQAVDLPDASVYQILYRSRATQPFSEIQLQELLAWSRAHNTSLLITGLLLYSDGRFVQVLEGPEAAVLALYARIQNDPRHSQVVTVRQGLCAERRFADWTMGMGRVAGPAVVRALDTILSHELVPNIEDPLLLALLQVLDVERDKASNED